jgi:glycerophosphoryl diester phosphodiesterase
MYIISHRGGSLESKENSREAIIHSLNNDKLSAIEVDINFTKDNVPVIIHDENLNRLFNLDINIYETEYYQIETVVLNLQKLLQLVNGKKSLFLEIKGNPNDQQIVILTNLLFNYIQNNINLSDLYNGNNIPIFMLITFNYDLLKKLNKYFDKSMLGLITANQFSKIDLYYLLDNKLFTNIIISNEVANKDNLIQLNKYDLNVFIYGINYINSLNKFSNDCFKNIKGFITDSPTSFTNKLCN